MLETQIEATNLTLYKKRAVDEEAESENRRDSFVAEAVAENASYLNAIEKLKKQSNEAVLNFRPANFIEIKVVHAALEAEKISSIV